MVDKFNGMTYLSLCILALFSMTSVSLAAGHHILVLPPACFFLWKFRNFRHLPASWWALIATFCLTVISVLLNWQEFDQPLSAVLRTKYLFFGAIAFFAVDACCKAQLEKRKITLLIHFLLISSAVAATSGLIALLTGFHPLRFKAACHPIQNCGMYGMQITYGYNSALIATIVVGMIFFWKEAQSWVSKKIFWICAILNLVGLVTSFSRGAILGFLASVALLIWMKSKKWAMSFATIAVLGVGLIGFITYSGKFSIDNRIFQPASSKSNMARVGQYQVIGHIFQERPFFGLGFRNFEPQSVAYKKKYNIQYHPEWVGHAHNNLLEFLVGSGIFAFLALLFWHFSWFVESLRGDWVDKIVSAFVLGVFVQGLFQSTMIDGEAMFLIMGIYATWVGRKICLRWSERLSVKK